MCNFLSWIELDKKLYYITDEDVKSEKGKELIKKSGSFQDAFGHGFIREYYDLGQAGQEKEVNDYWHLEKLPKELAEKVENLDNNFGYMFSRGGSLDLNACDLKGITLPESIGGYLYLRGCDLKGITLPESIGGSLDLSGCDLKGITLPERFNDKIIT